MTITAEMEYRDYVGLWEIAVKFCDVDFYGDSNEVRKLKKDWHDIEYADYETYDALAAKSREEAESLAKELEALDKELDELMFPLCFWRYEMHRELSERRDLVAEKAEEAKKKTKKLEDKMFKDVHKLKREAKDFLSGNGFVPKTTSHNENKNITTEIWVKP